MTASHTKEGETRKRFMRPAGPGAYDVIVARWVSTNYGGKHPGRGYWSENRWGFIRQLGSGKWTADHTIGDRHYPIEGEWPTAQAAAEAADEFAIEQGRIANAQVAYERANGWSTD